MSKEIHRAEHEYRNPPPPAPPPKLTLQLRPWLKWLAAVSELHKNKAPRCTVE